jgi:hypothetical protein
MFGSRIDSNTTKSKYSEVCLESPSILPPKSGLKRQVFVNGLFNTSKVFWTKPMPFCGKIVIAKLPGSSFFTGLSKQFIIWII